MLLKQKLTVYKCHLYIYIFYDYFFNYLKEYLTLSIFRIPREIILPEDAQLQNSIDNYSHEEDLELSKKLENAQKSLIEVI